MGHDEVSRKLSAYLDGEVLPEERVAIETHLRGCTDCAGVLEGLRAVGGYMKAYSFEMGEGTLKRLHGRVDEEIREVARRRVEWFAGALTGLAACVAVVVGLQLLRPPADSGQGVVPVATGNVDLTPITGPEVAEEG